MPTTRQEHVDYTRRELTTLPYYIKTLQTIKECEISSYIDIGANVGEFCNCLFDSIPTLQTAYLIEPQKDNFDFLKSHVKNKHSYFFNIAIGYAAKSGRLVLPNDNVGGYILMSGDNGEEVVVSTLEELSLPIVDFVKIDIEGGEYDVIENSKHLQQVNLIDIEFHDYYNKPTEAYVSKHFPNHRIVCIEDIKGRCLIKKQ